MSITFKELKKPASPTKEEILREMRKNWSQPYFYDGGARGEQAHYALESEAAYLDEFEDVPF